MIHHPHPPYTVRSGHAVFARLASRGSLGCCASVLLVALSACGGETPADVNSSGGFEPAENAVQVQKLRARHKALKQDLAQLGPKGHFIVVDSARNRLYVKRHGQVLLAATASTGSGTVLRAADRQGTQWVFDTPRGEFAVQSKLEHPVWVKPDWAFLEEGLTVPTDPRDRLEAGTLGDYALGFGKGFFIHGTLYTRLLGRNVTHGCIRLNDEDLRRTYHLAQIGTPVLIF